MKAKSFFRQEKRKAGNKDLAIASYKKSLELNPYNENAAHVIKEIEN